MRLLNARNLELEDFIGDNAPPYTILSHTWLEDEVTFQDLQRGHYEHKLGFKKIQYTCQQTVKDGFSYCWVDTCCIDKSSSAELTEAINSMFNWYARAVICYAYLADVDTGLIYSQRAGLMSEYASGSSFTNQEVVRSMMKDTRLEHQRFSKAAKAVYRTFLRNKRVKGLLRHATRGTASRQQKADYQNHVARDIVYLRVARRFDLKVTLRTAFGNSRWFTRGWTLQELIAPRQLQFYDTSWDYLGDRDTGLSALVCTRTGLDRKILGKPEALPELSIAQRMSWMADRQTTRKEDQAYCMLGILGVNMPLLYGEEDESFIRLQQEIAKRSNDHSLFVWIGYTPPKYRQILATSPRAFAACNKVEKYHSGHPDAMFPSSPYTLTNDGLRISLPLVEGIHQFAQSGLSTKIGLAVLHCGFGGRAVGLLLKYVEIDGELEGYISSEMDVQTVQKMLGGSALGAGFISIPKEVAITGKMKGFLIKEHATLGASGPSHSLMAWLRYSMSLQYEFASPDLGSSCGVARQRLNPPPHFVCLGRDVGKQGLAIRFSHLYRESLAVVLIIAGQGDQGASSSRSKIRSTLAAVDADTVNTGEKLLALAQRQHNIDEVVLDDATACMMSKEPLSHDEVLELWYEPQVLSSALDRTLFTLRMTSPPGSSSDRLRVLSDGTVE